jgi:hypothetical protein
MTGTRNKERIQKVKNKVEINNRKEEIYAAEHFTA